MGVVRRQGIKNTVTSYAGIGIGFIYLFVIAPNFLTKEELGLTRLLYSFSLLVAVLIPMGIGNATLRYFPYFKDKEKNHHGYFAFMNLFPLAGFVIAFGVLWLLKDFILNQYRNESPLFLEFFDYVFPLIFFNAFIATLSVYCNAHFKTTVPAFLNDIVVRLMTIAVVSVYYLKWLTLDQFIACFTGIYFIQMLVLLAYIFSFDKPRFRIDWAVFREKKIFELMKYGMLLWFASVASLGLKYFDSLMVGKFMPLAFVGIYTVAAFIPTVIEAPLNAIDKIASAKISFAWQAGDKDQIKQIYRKSSLYMFLLGSFIFLMVNVNIHTMLKYLPEGYQAGEMVVLIISIGTLFNMATGLNAPILFISEKFRHGAAFLILLAVIVLTLQMILIPLLGITGAALATALASVIYNTLLYVSVWRFFHLQPFDRKNLKVLMVLAATYGMTLLLPHFESKIFDLVFRTVITSLVFLAGIYASRVVEEYHHFLTLKRLR